MVFILHAETFGDDIGDGQPWRQGPVRILKDDLHVAPQRAAFA